jgi:hypothetical protein
MEDEDKVTLSREEYEEMMTKVKKYDHDKEKRNKQCNEWQKNNREKVNESRREYQRKYQREYYQKKKESKLDSFIIV